MRWLSASIVSSVGGPFVYIPYDSMMAAGHVAEAEGAGPEMGLYKPHQLNLEQKTNVYIYKPHLTINPFLGPPLPLPLRDRQP